MKLRTLVGISLAVAAQAGWSQDQAPVTTVTYRTGAAPLRTVVADLAKLTHLKLSVSTLRDQPVVLAVKDIPVKALFARLATMTDAVWEKDGDTYVLSRDKGREREAEGVEAEDRAVRFGPAIETYIKTHAADADWSEKAIADRIQKDKEAAERLQTQVQGNDGAVQVISSSDVTPGGSVLLEALRKLPVRVLASLKPGQRVVFATVPNVMQKALPYNASNSIADFVTAYNRLAAASQKEAADRPTTGNVQTQLNGVTQPTDGVAKMILAISRPAKDQGISLDAFLVDRRGNILDNPHIWLTPEMPKAPEVPAGIDGKVKWTDATRALLRALRPSQAQSGNSISFNIRLGGDMSASLGADSPHSLLDADMTKLFADPVANEPLSYFVTETLFALADQTGESVMAMVPDSMFGDMAMKLNGSEIGLKTLWTQAPAFGIAIDHDADGYLVHPRLFAEADRCRINRPELARLTQGIAKKDYANLDEISRYSLAAPAIWDDSNLDGTWLRALSPATLDQYDQGPTHLTYLRLYGTLTPAQRAADSNRARINFLQLSNQQKALIEQIAYAATGPMMIGNGTMMMVSSSPATPGGRQPRQTQIAMREPTEALPNGLPPMGMPDLVRKWEDGVFSRGADGHGTFFSAGDIGLRMGINPGSLPPGMKYETSFERMLLAELTDITMTLTFARTPKSETLRDANLKAGSSTYTMATLPKGMLDRIDRARQQAMNMKFGTMTVGGGGTKPPE